MVSNPSSFPSETFGWAVIYVRFTPQKQGFSGESKNVC